MIRDERMWTSSDALISSLASIPPSITRRQSIRSLLVPVDKAGDRHREILPWRIRRRISVSVQACPSTCSMVQSMILSQGRQEDGTLKRLDREKSLQSDAQSSWGEESSMATPRPTLLSIRIRIQTRQSCPQTKTSSIQSKRVTSMLAIRGPAVPMKSDSTICQPPTSLSITKAMLWRSRPFLTRKRSKTCAGTISVSEVQQLISRRPWVLCNTDQAPQFNVRMHVRR